MMMAIGNKRDIGWVAWATEANVAPPFAFELGHLTGKYCKVCSCFELGCWMRGCSPSAGGVLGAGMHHDSLASLAEVLDL